MVVAGVLLEQREEARLVVGVRLVGGAARGDFGRRAELRREEGDRLPRAGAEAMLVQGVDGLGVPRPHQGGGLGRVLVDVEGEVGHMPGMDRLRQCWGTVRRRWSTRGCWHRLLARIMPCRKSGHVEMPLPVSAALAVASTVTKSVALSSKSSGCWQARHPSTRKAVSWSCTGVKISGTQQDAYTASHTRTRALRASSAKASPLHRLVHEGHVDAQEALEVGERRVGAQAAELQDPLISRTPSPPSHPVVLAT